MNVKEDALRVSHHPTDIVSGEKLEPEERPAERLMLSEAAIRLGNGPNDPDAKPISLTMPSVVNMQMSAGTVAQNVASQCSGCKHFNQRAFTQLRRHWQLKNPDAVGNLKAELFAMGYTEAELPPVVLQLGICEAQSEIFKDPVITFPWGGCPEDRGPAGEDLSKLYGPRDAQAKRQASQAFDRIMRMAQGRTS